MSRALTLEYGLDQIKQSLSIPNDLSIAGLFWDAISKRLSIRVEGPGLPLVSSHYYPLCLVVKHIPNTQAEMNELLARLE